MKIFYLILLVSCLQSGNYRFEGVYNEPDGERRFFLPALFLPYNPKILALNDLADAEAKCRPWWPQGTFYKKEECDLNLKYDFIWIDSNTPEQEILYAYADILEKSSAIYTSTHFQDLSYQNMRFFLELSGFTLLSHWFWEGDHGHAIFLKKDLFDAAMRGLNHSPKTTGFKFVPQDCNLERYFQKLGPKSGDHSYDEIDFIYMINLDERPQKFSSAAGRLNPYDIHPFRFSAVNGWKLSLSTINDVGIKFYPGMLDDPLMGTTYVEIDKALYRSNELIQEDGRTYFSMGLSQGAIGIILSHLSILQDAYDSGYETIWVLEDDVEPCEDPRQIPEIIRNLDRLVGYWDILFTDTDTKDRNGKHVPCRALATRPNFYTETLEAFLQKFYPIGCNLSRIGMRYGAYSMIIRRSGIKKILNHFKTYGIFLPYDMDFWLIPEIKMYAVDRDIVSHATDALTDNSYPNFEKE